MKSSFNKIQDYASPVTYIGLDNLKVHLGIFEDNGEDSYLSSLLLTAQELVSDFVGMDFGSITREELFNKLDGSPLELMRNSTSSLEVKYYNSSEVLTTLDPALYIVDSTSSKDVIRFKKDAVLPTDTSELMENFIVVQYISLVDADNVPEAVIVATYMYCTEMYNNRSNSSDKKLNSLPLSAERLLMPLREVRI